MLLRLKKIFLKFNHKINFPPPWKFLSQGKIVKRQNINKNIVFLFIEIIQLFLWIIKSLKSTNKFYYDKNQIPFKLYFLASIVNCFEHEELKILYKLGFDNWKKISVFNPELQTLYIHQKNRINYPNECQKIIAKIGDKYKLYELVPENYKVPIFVIKDGQHNNFYPDWWKEYLNKSGLILKPIFGSKKQGVIRFRYREGKLIIQRFFGTNSYKSIEIVGEYFSIQRIFQIWQESYKKNLDALVMPYLKNDSQLSKDFPSIVIRVITFLNLKSNHISCSNAWLEIFNVKDKEVFLSENGIKLSFCRKNRNYQYSSLNLNDFERHLITQCKEGSIEIHSKLDLIDSVAFDWVPTKDGPKFLEANSCYGFFIPQLFSTFSKKKLYHSH